MLLMLRGLLVALFLLIGCQVGHAACLGAAPTTVQAPAIDALGNMQTIPCGPHIPVTYAAPNSATIATANQVITVFNANSAVNGCDIKNPGSNTVTIYVDFVSSPVAGKSTTLPIEPGNSYHCPFPPTGAVMATAGAPVTFTAMLY